ncbi:cysteine-rich receptor-like protein kinase 8 [Tanacetum coccineum]
MQPTASIQPLRNTKEGHTDKAATSSHQVHNVTKQSRLAKPSKFKLVQKIQVHCLLLISKKLTRSNNYSSWKTSVMIALIAKNKMKLVTGEFPEPTMESDLREIWERKNDMLISWILNIVIKQENCSVEVYYHKLKGWDEYDALEAPYMCICVCNYNNGRINGERDQRKRLIQFLMGLDEGYFNVKGQILLMQPFLSAAIAYTMVRQEEKQRE